MLLNLRPGADGTLGSWTRNPASGTWAAKIAQDPDAHDNGSSYVQAPNVADDSMFVTVAPAGGFPANFDPAVNSITVRVAALFVNTPQMAVDTCDLYLQLFRSDETTAMSAESTACNVTVTSGYTIFERTIALSGSHTLSDWQGARLRLRQDHTAVQTTDTTAQIRVTAANVVVDYTSTQGTAAWIHRPERWREQPRVPVELNAGNWFVSSQLENVLFPIIGGYDWKTRRAQTAGTSYVRTLRGTRWGLGLDFPGTTDRFLESPITWTSRSKSSLAIAVADAFPASAVEASIITHASAGVPSATVWGGTLGVNNAGTVRYQDYDGSLRYGTAGSVSAGQLFVAAGACESGVEMRAALDGKLGTAGAIGSATEITPSLVFSHNKTDNFGPFGLAYFDGAILLAASWSRALSAYELVEITRAPWQMFRPTHRRLYHATSGGGAGTQDLQPSLYSDADTFHAPAVAAGSVDLTPALFADADTFFSPSVGSIYELEPALFADGDTFFTPSVAAGAVDLAPELFAEADTFHTPSVSGGVLDLQPEHFASANTFHVPEVAPVLEGGVDGSGIRFVRRKKRIRVRPKDKERLPEDYERERKMLEEYLESLEKKARQQVPPTGAGDAGADGARLSATSVQAPVASPAAAPRLTEAMARVAREHELQRIAQAEVAAREDRERARREHVQRYAESFEHLASQTVRAYSARRRSALQRALASRKALLGVIASMSKKLH
jgi:hypothetical protein